MNITYTFNKCSRRVAVLLLASMGVFSSVQAQTYANGTRVNANVLHKQGYIASGPTQWKLSRPSSCSREKA